MRKSYGFWVLLAEAVGILAGVLTRTGTEVYGMTITKPPLSPPAILFPIVWTILYALMGISAARVEAAPSSPARSLGLKLWWAQLAANFLWSIIFFRFQAFGLAFIWLVLLWLLIFWMIREFFRVDPAAAWLQVPYLLWVTFAGYLNLAVFLLNP